MKGLNASPLGDTLKKCISMGKPVLGICLGTQIILNSSEEDGGVDCLGIVEGKTVKFEFEDENVTIPQMGWNQVETKLEHPVFNGIPCGTNFYFVHSYYPQPTEEKSILAQTDYAGKRFTSAISCDNLIATQFHPEKSGRHGLQLLKNFSQWDGTLNA